MVNLEEEVLWSDGVEFRETPIEKPSDDEKQSCGEFACRNYLVYVLQQWNIIAKIVISLVIECISEELNILGSIPFEN